MASVYVHGDPTRSLEQYKDTSEGYVSRDFTYYGNGCEKTWGDGGSDIPCSTRIVTTSDNEDQKNGTYYHFQAATSGTGSSITTENTLVPDSFCPLGWQLPYGGTGGDYYDKSRSWKYLAGKYNLLYSTDVKVYPFSFVLGGSFFQNSGLLFNQNLSGNYPVAAIGTRSYHNYSFSITAGFNYATSENKGNANPVRCI